jgi:membrane protease subunit HflC
MRKLSLPIIILLVVIAGLLISGSFFIVNQTESALVLQFGESRQAYTQPGLKVKIPFIQEVIFYDNRLLHYNFPALEVNAADQKRLVVDLYARYRIVDVLKFYRTIGQDIHLVDKRLSGIVLDTMQQIIGRIPLSYMLSEKRAGIMKQIHERTRETAKEFGIDVIDVRIIRADLPRENSEAIFNRMESERIQEAKLFRAEGDEQNQGIRAQADRERTIILAEAQQKADTLRGEGEGEATRIYAGAYDKDRNFYSLYRSLIAYENSLKPEDTSIVLSPNKSEFLKYFSVTNENVN